MKPARNAAKPAPKKKPATKAAPPRRQPMKPADKVEFQKHNARNILEKGGNLPHHLRGVLTAKEEAAARFRYGQNPNATLEAAKAAAAGNIHAARVHPYHAPGARAPQDFPHVEIEHEGERIGILDLNGLSAEELDSFKERLRKRGGVMKAELGAPPESQPLRSQTVGHEPARPLTNQEYRELQRMMDMGNALNTQRMAAGMRVQNARQTLKEAEADLRAVQRDIQTTTEAIQALARRIP